MSRIHRIPVIRKFLKKLDSDVKNFGWQKAAMNVVLNTHSKVQIIGLDRTIKNILKHDPVIIIANHPYEAETIGLVASLPDRCDSYLIVNAMLKGICPEIDKHLIPIYLRKTRNNKSKSLLGAFMDKLHPPKFVLSDKEAHAKNIESIKFASEKIMLGGLVIIYPAKGSKDGHWFDGVGYLIKGLGLSSNAMIVKVYTNGTSNWDYFRLIPYVGKIAAKVDIIFSKAEKVSSYLNLQPKEIVRKLEISYTKWIEGLTNG